MCGAENGAPGAIPTRDLSLRRRALYAAELREHMWGGIVSCKSCKSCNPVSDFHRIYRMYKDLRLVLDQRPDVVACELLTARQEFELDDEYKSDDHTA